MTTKKKKNIKKLIKVVAIILVIVALVNFVCPARSQAKVSNEFLETCEEIFSTLLDGLLGLLFWPFRLLILLVGKGAEVLLGFFVPGGGKVTIEGILFNKIDVLSIDFMNVDGTDYPPAKILRQNVASWYLGVRNLSAAILVVICIYIGIRMALATATDKAKYKEMLMSWLSSVALLFVLHYIMAGVIALNNVVVNAIGSGIAAGDTSNSINILTETFFDKALWNISFAQSTAYSVCYLMLTFMTFTFIIMYLKRLITIAFLMIIAPLVTITYSIDKMGDGKAQGLNNWFREFAYNIVIQPFHCIAYAALGGMAATLAASDGAGLAEGVACVVIIGFIMKSEKILKTIFHMQSDSMMDALNSAAIAANISNRAMQFSKQVSGSVKQGIKANRQNANEIRKVKDEIRIAKGKTTRAEVDAKNAKRLKKQEARAAKKKEFQDKHPKISGFSRDLLTFQGDANATLFNGAMAFSIGMAQGNENAAIISGLKAAEATHKERKKQGQEYKQDVLQHNMAKAYNDYRDQMINGDKEKGIKGIVEELSEDPNFVKLKDKEKTELIERTFDRKVQDLLNKGVVTNLNNPEEENLVRAMDDLQRELISQGMSGDNAMKQVKSVVGKIANGDIGEIENRDISFNIRGEDVVIPIGSVADYELGTLDVGGHRTTTEVIEKKLKETPSNPAPQPTPQPGPQQTQSSGRKSGPAKGASVIKPSGQPKIQKGPRAPKQIKPSSNYTNSGPKNSDKRLGYGNNGPKGRR